MMYPKADTGKRIVAAILDSLLASLFYFLVLLLLGFIPVLGWLFRLAAGLILLAFLAFKDALPIAGLQGASPGKKVLGIKAIKMDGTRCDYASSFKRNLPFVAPAALAFLVGIVPWLGVYLSVVFVPLISIASLIIVIIELVRVLTEPKGLRFGDMFATTQVVEFRHLTPE